MPILSEDVSEGMEPYKIPVVNEFNYETLPPFEYIPSTRISKELLERAAKGGISETMGCQCVDSACSLIINAGKTDACVSQHEVIFWGPTARGFCTDACRCPPTCPQRFANARLKDARFQLYFVGPKVGWGLRTLEEIPPAAILFEYAGEMTEQGVFNGEPSTETEENGGQITKGEEIGEPMEIEQGEGEYDLDEEFLYAAKLDGKEFNISAKHCGNIARFLNHSCEPNVEAKKALLGPLRVPYVYLETIRKVSPGEQLTLDYGDEYWTRKPFGCECGFDSCMFAKDQEGNWKNGCGPENLEKKFITDLY